MVIALLLFVGLIRFFCRRFGISPKPLFQDFWKYCCIIFLSGTYSYYLIEEGVFIPLHRKQLLLYISPYDYHFYSVGMMIAIGYIFSCVYQYAIGRQQKQLRIHMLFDAMMISSIFFFICLILADNFFEVSTGR